MLRWGIGMVLSLVLVGLAAAPAHGLPGDPPIEVLEPADGATLPVADIIPTHFTCPVYRQFDYYWQVARSCVGCPGGYEVGPVRRLVLRTTARLSLRPPARVYGGFKFIQPLRLSGVPDRTRVRVEYRSGSRWRPAGSAIALGGRGDASVVLPVGRTRLRATVRLGAETVRSRPVRLIVRRARRWTTSARDDGRYVMRSGGQRTKGLRVTRGGRELRGFEAEVPLLCPSVLPGLPFTNQTGYAAVGRVRIAPDGSFLGVATAKSTSIRVRGKLRGRRIHAGKVELSVKHCSGSLKFTARRAGA